MKILIVDDFVFVLERLKELISVLWPSEIPVEVIAVQCLWADAAIRAVEKYQPDFLLLDYSFRGDEKTGKDVALWIDRNYQKPIHVATHSRRPENEARRLFSGAECVKHFIYGFLDTEHLKEFIESCTKQKGEN